MAILSDKHIQERLDSGTYPFNVTPEVDSSQIQPGSLDVRLGSSYSNENTGEFYEDQDEVIIEPGQFYLAHTREHIEMPDDLSAMVSGRSSFGRKGLLVHATAGWIDACFSGDITLEMFNLTEKPISIEPGTRIAQLVFFQMTSPAETPYDAQPNSKYNGQSGPTPSRID